MTLFADKHVFKLLGLEAIQPSPLHTSQDCTICTEPLAMQPSPTQEKDSQYKLHAAVRISACGHIVGEECLDAWLDTGSSCPTCKRELFDAKGDAITRQDIEDVIKSLSRYHGIYRVTESISRVVKRRDGKYIPRLPVRGGATRQEEVEVVVEEEEEEEEEDIGYYGGEVWGNEEEMEFGEDAGNEDMEVDEGYEDGDEEWEEDDDDDDDECDDGEGQEYKGKGVTGSET